jgi:hypothetical protein
MARPFFVFLSLSLLLSSCTQRLICPAFQSAYIYDKDELRKKFSYFLEDSTPKILTASKTKYLIAEPVSYRKKLRSIQTVQMKPVNPVLPDSMRLGEDEGLLGEDGVVPGAELDLAARSVIDSTYIVDVPQDTTEAEADSVYMISRDKELRLLKYNFPDSLRYDETTGKYVTETPRYAVANVTYNVEQDNYMWYLRGNLVLPDVRLAQLMQSEDRAAEGKAKKGKKEKKGFFKNLFKRKNRAPVDSAAIQPVPAREEEFDFVDETETVAAPVSGQEETKEKKGLFRKKKKAPAEQAEVETTPEEEKPKRKKKEKAKAEEAKPEEEPPQDDGF